LDAFAAGAEGRFGRDPCVMPGWLTRARLYHRYKNLGIEKCYNAEESDTFFDLGVWLGVLSVECRERNKPIA
jgi:hypothetical protein